MHWQVGDVSISRVVEITSSSLGAHILPDAKPEIVASIPWIDPFVDENHALVMSFHALLVKTSDSVLLVDTCIGNQKTLNYPKWNKMQTEFMADLNELGVAKEQVDTILCTHMHVDHVGWNTHLVDGRWVPTFPNARYLFAEQEWLHWQHDDDTSYGPVVEESVQPIFDHGLADLVASTHEVSTEISLFPTPGHTPGHVSVHIRSKGEEAVITGDIFHHPCQLAYEEWSATADLDAVGALETRRNFLRTFADRPVLVIGTHFAGPTAGHIVRDGDAFRLDY